MRPRRFLLTLLTLLVLTARPLVAAPVTLAWDPNPEADLAGYRLSYGTVSGVYTTTVDVGNVTTWTLTLPAGARYVLALRAYNTAGLVSPYSTEVTSDQTIPPSVAPTTTTLVMTGVSPTLTFTATVTSGAGVPTGTVMFKDLGINQGVFPVSATGGATWGGTLNVGAHLVTAEYSGAQTFGASVSAGLTFTVGSVVVPPGAPTGVRVVP